MVGFLDNLSAMLGAQPQSAGMTNYGALAQPSVAAQTGTILAQLKPMVAGQQAQSDPSNPLGLSQPLLGNDVSAALSGLSQVDPTRSKFGAFAQGLAGGLAARQNAQVESTKLGIARQNATIEALKNMMEIRQQQRMMAGADAAAAVGNPSSSSPSMGAPAPTMSSAPPMTLQAPMGGAPSASAPAPAMGGTPAAPAPQTSGPDIPIENTPQGAFQRAALLSARADAALKYGNQQLAGVYQQRAAQEQQRGTAMMQSGKTVDRNGNVISLPGFLSTEASDEAAKTGARVAAENAGKPVINPDGSSYIPAPGSAPSPASPPPAGPTIANTPTQATVDPATAQITSSIPSAPPGGGYPMPNMPAGAKLVGVGQNAKNQADADKDFEDIVGKSPALDQGIERYKAAAQALKLFQSGSGGDYAGQAGAIAQTLGAPDWVTQGLARGDPAATQWLQKQGVGLTLDTLKAAQPRFAQKEFTTVADKGVPSPDNLPQANHQLISEGLGSMMRSRQFIQDWQVANQNGWTSPSAFYAKWAQANPLEPYVISAQKQIGTFKGMDLPSASDMTVGATYIAPKSMTPQQASALAARGVQPGAMFRYNGPKADQIVSPIAPSQAYSAHLTQ